MLMVPKAGLGTSIVRTPRCTQVQGSREEITPLLLPSALYKISGYKVLLDMYERKEKKAHGSALSCDYNWIMVECFY